MCIYIWLCVPVAQLVKQIRPVLVRDLCVHYHFLFEHFNKPRSFQMSFRFPFHHRFISFVYSFLFFFFLLRYLSLFLSLMAFLYRLSLRGRSRTGTPVLGRTKAWNSRGIMSPVNQKPFHSSSTVCVLDKAHTNLPLSIVCSSSDQEPNYSFKETQTNNQSFTKHTAPPFPAPLTKSISSFMRFLICN